MSEFLTAVLAAAFTVVLTASWDVRARRAVRLDEAVVELRLAASDYWIHHLQASAGKQGHQLPPTDLFRACMLVEAHASRGVKWAHPHRHSLGATIRNLQQTLSAEWTKPDVGRHVQIVQAMEAAALKWISESGSWRGDRSGELLDLMDEPVPATETP